MNASNATAEPLFPLNYPDYVYNFAYGSNMLPSVLTGRRKIHPIESISGILEGWQLTFDFRGIPAVEPCFGNIKENPDAEIHGVLHKITSKEFKHLMATEGGSGVDATGYIPKKVTVHAYDGRIIEAYVLVVQQTSPAILYHHALPSNRYIGLLRSGAIHYKIHPLYIEYLQSLPSVEHKKPIIGLVIIEILILTTSFAPIWIPKIIYFLCKDQKAHAQAFFFTLIITNLWRIYRFFGRKSAIQPYYSASFPRGSTRFKENTETFRDEVQTDEQTLPDTVSDIYSELILSPMSSPLIKQRKTNQNVIEEVQQLFDQ
ncbi:unnamed protein product [Rotaria sp. Silwood1]|nr:unnamed protein product [Rotaria sp. Silwood1]CAF1489100.1 unnamed protein product [Rotaria sp. Silwood1]CAF3591168.1 unnamed protein product [Rotaria sp. Silwood1]CAF4784672.1 unnamed protein product [Rotaria sp. Silwood1]